MHPLQIWYPDLSLTKRMVGLGKMLKPSLMCVQCVLEMAEFVYISKAKYSHGSCLWHLLRKIPLYQGPACV